MEPRKKPFRWPCKICVQIKLPFRHTTGRNFDLITRSLTFDLQNFRFFFLEIKTNYKILM